MPARRKATVIFSCISLLASANAIARSYWLDAGGGDKQESRYIFRQTKTRHLDRRIHGLTLETTDPARSRRSTRGIERQSCLPLLERFFFHLGRATRRNLYFHTYFAYFLRCLCHQRALPITRDHLPKILAWPISKQVPLCLDTYQHC
jgi:hypothetical protein